MNPLSVVSAIRGLIRIGRTAADAYAQHAQERPILLPDANFAALGPRETILEMTQIYPDFGNLLKEDPDLSNLWKNNRFTQVDGAEDAILAVAYRFKSSNAPGHSEVGAQPAAEVAGGIVVGQWAKGNGPVRPWTRIIVAMADVALEYVGGRPEILGIGGNGEKLIGALAQSIATAIPDAHTRDALGPKDRFAERLSVLVLQAGLKTLTEKSDLVFKEDHLQVLLEKTLPPIIDALPDDIKEQVKWREVNDSLLGPAVSAAIGAIADNQQDFFGKGVSTDKAAGVLVNALLTAAKDLKPSERFERESLLALFQATAKAASLHPELVLGELLDKDLSDEDNRKATGDLLVNLFKSVTDAVAKDQEDLGIAIAAAAIDGLKDSVPSLVKSGPWESVVEDVSIGILEGFKEAVGDDELTLKNTLFTKKFRIDVATIVIEHVAANPHLVVGDKEELKRIVSSIAKAMKQDEENLLLTSNDWTKIVGVAMQEAAINPGRLFGINDKSLSGGLATDIIGGILKAASNDLTRNDRAVGPVLVGETLREAISVTLRGISSNVEQAFTQRAAIDSLATALNDAVAIRGLSMGGKEWIRLFKKLLPDVLSTGTIPTLDNAKIATLLAA